MIGGAQKMIANIPEFLAPDLEVGDPHTHPIPMF